MLTHLLGTTEMDAATATHILDTAENLARLTEHGKKNLPTLQGRRIATLFFEDSTRTRISFEAAARRLSAETITFTTAGSSTSKGESLKDTAQSLAAIGAEAFILRHRAAGAAHQLAYAGWVDGPVINAGDGAHEHPTQALLDTFTLRRHLAARRGITAPEVNLQGARVVIVGDVLHSRVARSNLRLLHTLGARVTLVAPPTLRPYAAESWPCLWSEDLDAALAEPLDALMLLRVQHERMEGVYLPSPREYVRYWGLNDARLATFIRNHPQALLMHPGPVNRGMELSSRAVDAPQSAILDQVHHGVLIRMAVLYLLLAGAP